MDENKSTIQDTVLIVDDEQDLLIGLKRTLEMELGCNILTADSGKDALQLIRKESVDIVLSDINMPEIDGIALLKGILEYDSNITVIMMTAYGTIEVAVEAIKNGAYDFIQKPFEEDSLIRLLKKGSERNKLVRENKKLKQHVTEFQPFENMVGKSPKLLRTFESIRTLGKTDVTVLILGETGTGKDLAAQALHASSSRRHKDLVTVNCPALPEGLLESELFGHRKGAFTNASEDKKGLFDQADGGTIFLDEIGDLPMPLQTKLLRVLQNREVKPLGASKSHQVDVRIIAATNQDLINKIERKEFRADLYYRLNVAMVTMPPLREVKEDIPLFVEHFLSKAASEMGTEQKSVSIALLNMIEHRDWPGNFRELENTIRGWVAITGGDHIDINCMSDNMESVDVNENDIFASPYKELKDEAIEKFTLKYLDGLLKHTSGNVSLSAQISGIQRQSLQKIIKRYDIDIESYRDK